MDELLDQLIAAMDRVDSIYVETEAREDIEILRDAVQALASVVRVLVAVTVSP